MDEEKRFGQKLLKLREEIKDQIDRWNTLKTQGGSDPFWADGVNMNLVRQHVITCKKEIEKICRESDLSLPEEYWVSVPPKE